MDVTVAHASDLVKIAISPTKTDDNDTENARICRTMALKILDGLILFDQGPKENSEGLVLQKTDILRRTGSFEEAIEFCDSEIIKMTDYLKILKFQKELSKNMDCRRYSTDKKLIVTEKTEDKIDSRPKCFGNGTSTDIGSPEYGYPYSVVPFTRIFEYPFGTKTTFFNNC